jgi:hypothetical protein
MLYFLPYNWFSRVRYKVLTIKNGEYRTPFQNTPVSKTEWNTCGWAACKHNNSLDENKRAEEEGFHVFVNKQDAIDEAENFSCSWKPLFVVKIKVRGFLNSGFWGYRWDIETETWKQFKIIERVK